MQKQKQNYSYLNHQMYLKIRDMFNDPKIHFLDEPTKILNF